jgi:hypothetical protein
MDKRRGGLIAEAEAPEERDEPDPVWVFEDACRTENCVSWSAEGTLAVVSGSLVTLSPLSLHRLILKCERVGVCLCEGGCGWLMD